MDFRTLLVRDSDNPFFRRLEVGRFSLSVQASAGHYCTPRKSGLPAKDYTAFEVALFENEEWISEPWNHPVLKGFTTESDWEPGSGKPVAGWLPAEKVQLLWEALNLSTAA